MELHTYVELYALLFGERVRDLRRRVTDFKNLTLPPSEAELTAMSDGYHLLPGIIRWCTQLADDVQYIVPPSKLGATKRHLDTMLQTATAALSACDAEFRDMGCPTYP